MEKEIYYGRGTHEQFDEYMALINKAFDFDDVNNFEKLLPKLYRPELDPAYNSFVAIEDSKMVAAVGAYPNEIEVCGIKLKGVGIGNVACHPDYRSRGFMTKLITQAVQDMIDNGVDYSSLGGQRQRYQHFSYDRGGIEYNLWVGKDNLRYIFGNSVVETTVEELRPDDDASLDAIYELYMNQPYHCVRERSEFYNIMCSWHCVPYIFKNNEKFIGYCVFNQGNISEILAVSDEALVDMVRSAVQNLSDIKIWLPDFMQSYIKVLEPITDGIEVKSNHQFTVFCFKRVLEAFLKLKATYTTLCDGKLNVLIHGKAKDEKLCISVENNIVSVEMTDEKADLELSHIDAIAYFFAPVSSIRTAYGKAPSQWFPVPLWKYGADEV